MTAILNRYRDEKHLVEGQDYVVREIDFGNSAADGAVMSCEDGVPNIYINGRVCPKRRREALEHELEHIVNNDLYSDRPIEEIEKRA